MIARSTLKEAVSSAFRSNPIVTILGPRQCGKTTLARVIAAERDDCEYFDLEDPVDIGRLSAPMQALAPLSGLVIIDEIQRKPELFELLRVCMPMRQPRRNRCGSACGICASIKRPSSIPAIALVPLAKASA